MVVKKATLEEAIKTSKIILLEGAESKQDWLKRYETDMKMIVVPMDVLSTMYLELSIEKKGTIKIMTGQGLVQSVDGLPEGYDYEIIECDKCGEPLPIEDE